MTQCLRTKQKPGPVFASGPGHKLVNGSPTGSMLAEKCVINSPRPVPSLQARIRQRLDSKSRFVSAIQCGGYEGTSPTPGTNFFDGWHNDFRAPPPTDFHNFFAPEDGRPWVFLAQFSLALDEVGELRKDFNDATHRNGNRGHLPVDMQREKKVPRFMCLRTGAPHKRKNRPTQRIELQCPSLSSEPRSLAGRFFHYGSWALQFQENHDFKNLSTDYFRTLYANIRDYRCSRMC